MLETWGRRRHLCKAVGINENRIAPRLHDPQTRKPLELSSDFGRFFKTATLSAIVHSSRSWIGVTCRAVAEKCGARNALTLVSFYDDTPSEVRRKWRTSWAAPQVARDLLRARIGELDKEAAELSLHDVWLTALSDETIRCADFGRLVFSLPGDDDNAVSRYKRSRALPFGYTRCFDAVREGMVTALDTLHCHQAAGAEASTALAAEGGAAERAATRRADVDGEQAPAPDSEITITWATIAVLRAVIAMLRRATKIERRLLLSLLRLANHDYKTLLRAMEAPQRLHEFLALHRSWHLRHGAHPPDAYDVRSYRGCVPAALA